MPSRYSLTPHLHACTYCGATPPFVNHASGNLAAGVPAHTLCDACLRSINQGKLDPIKWWNAASASNPPVLSKSPSPSLSPFLPRSSHRSLGLPLPSPPPPTFQSETRSRHQLEVVQLEGPVIGYRGWDFAPDGGVCGAIVSEPWPKGVGLATCDRDSHYEPPPIADCHCGFYAWSDIGRTFEYGQIVGAVQLWGKLIEHGDEGWRGEKARILAFAGSDDRAKQAAAYYKVPLLEEQEKLVILAKELAI